ncbi:hypothetical protein HYH02_011335 [Chlamydomonas schloesseri]|uniref:Uncharacterized protein n=1 Tax=Chlamydomonas schloesseri TaxID=2026947 RepID=A0A835TF25_9CHLO|nr:hypothetical protein HYH02_011335 [Chlamydomonas schloesseri]|eukprot:KAG2437076.1 hypothetical protein HYH02_011335 [Chlamydomonas schloesseri]
MGQCSGKFLDILTEDEVQAAVKAIVEWEDAQKSAQKATQALKTVRKDSFKKATNDLNHSGGIVERLGGPDRVHDVIQTFYRKLFQNAMVRHYFENLSSDRMRSKQMKFMRYIMGGPGTYTGNLRCIHAQMVKEEGLDKAKFQVVIGLLMDTFKELDVPEDVVSDVLGHVESAKSAIFTPQPDELVSAEELTAAAAEVGRSCPLVGKLGGPEAVQGIIASFYKRLFSSEELKYFFVGLSSERLRTMQFRFMRYLLAGPGWYATTGGNMRCVHARMIAEGGLDLPKFQAVTAMLRAACDEHLVSPAYIKEIMINVKAAEQAIFTPGPDELMSREEFEAELAAVEAEEAARLAADQQQAEGALPGQPHDNASSGAAKQQQQPTGLVRRVGGAEAAYELVRRLYSRLFSDEVLKGFFSGLSVERLKTKQLRFMRYLLGGPPAYAAATGGADLRCPHLKLMQPRSGNDLARISTDAASSSNEDGGGGGTPKAAGRRDGDVLNGTKFDRLVGMLTDIMEELSLPQDVRDDILYNVECARTAIFTPGAGERQRSSTPTTTTITTTTTTTTTSAAGPSIYERLGGEEVLCDLVDMWAGKLSADPALAHVYGGGVDMPRQRTHQLAFLRQAFGAGAGGAGGVASRPGSACPVSGGGGGGVVGAMRLEIAAAHLARDKALGPEQFERIADHLAACLKKEGASPQLIAEVRAMQGPGRCLLWPPSSAAAPAAACPFAASLLGDELPVTAAPAAAPAAQPSALAALSPRLSAPPTNMTSYDERALDAIVATNGHSAADAAVAAPAATAAAGSGSNKPGPAAASRPASGASAASGVAGKAGGLTKSDFVRRPSANSSNAGAGARPSAELLLGSGAGGSRPGTASLAATPTGAAVAAAGAPVVRGASVSSSSSSSAAIAAAAAATEAVPAAGEAAVVPDGLFGDDDEELLAAMERAAGLQQPMARAGSVRA